MQTILEHGIVIEYNNEDEFAQTKAKIDNFVKFMKENLPSRTAIHEVSLLEDVYLTCSMLDGEIRFGLYNKKTGLFKRNFTAQDANLIDTNKITLLTWRLLAAINKPLDIPPLNEVWNLSIQKELELSDKYSLVELDSPDALNFICVKDEKLDTFSFTPSTTFNLKKS